MKETQLENASIVAYLAARGLSVKPFYDKTTRRVAFTVESDSLEAIYQEICDNKPIGISDYLKALSSVRGAIFTVRKMYEQ